MEKRPLGATDQEMLTIKERKSLYDVAYVPEHLPDYVEAVSGAEPFLHEDHLCFFHAAHLIFIGYPLHVETVKTPRAYESACRRFRPSSAAIIAPSIWIEPTALNGLSEDTYYKLELPLPLLKADISYMIRRAERELGVFKGAFGKEHEDLIGSFIAAREFSQGHREIFQQIPKYLANSSTAIVLEARRREELVAFNIVDLGSAENCFYLFNFRSLKSNVPGASDLLFYEMARLARTEGKKAVNLGLGINDGVRRFKEKWGAVPFLPYASASVSRKRSGLLGAIAGYRL